MKYSIVVFLQGNSTSVVPTSWTFQKDNGDWMCYWPRYYGAKQLEAVVKQSVSSQSSWKIYACRILRRFGMCLYNILEGGIIAILDFLIVDHNMGFFVTMKYCFYANVLQVTDSNS